MEWQNVEFLKIGKNYLNPVLLEYCCVKTSFGVTSSSDAVHFNLKQANSAYKVSF